MYLLVLEFAPQWEPSVCEQFKKLAQVFFSCYFIHLQKNCLLLFYIQLLPFLANLVPRTINSALVVWLSLPSQWTALLVWVLFIGQSSLFSSLHMLMVYSPLVLNRNPKNLGHWCVRTFLALFYQPQLRLKSLNQIFWLWLSHHITLQLLTHLWLTILYCYLTGSTITLWHHHLHQHITNYFPSC